MIGAELIAELDESSYNLNTSPWTVNLQGNLYDYHFFAFCDSGSTTSGRLDITLNSDTGSNYNRYIMYGLSSTASASKNTHTEMRVSSFTRNQSSRNSLAYGSLTGSSGDNRKLHIVSSSGYDPQINIHDFYWTNTVDPVDEITFTGSVSASYKWHIIVYRTPKESVQGTWEYMAELNWSSESTEKSFTVDGDEHKQYRLVWDGDQQFNVECNNDNGSNYTSQILSNSNGTLGASRSTTQTDMRSQSQGNFVINAESGVDRLVYVSSSRTTSSQQIQRAYWWRNTGDNLNSLDCTPLASATGTAKLYRRINPTITADVFPFETIKTFDVSGDYSSGDTLSGLTCDDYKMIKIEWLGSNTSGSSQINVQLNSDTGSNYTRQQLYGQSSTAGAGSGTIAHFRLANPQNGDMSRGVIYLYPKSGEYRPVLKRGMYNENTIVFTGAWWLNSADEITSIKTFANNTNSMSGQIKISVLR